MSAKIAIVVQRYGLEVNGGAEYHARVLAQKLAKSYHVEVLTTTALDYHGWDNHYAEGLTEIDAIKVHRFKTKNVSKSFDRKVHRALFQRKKYFKILKFFGLFDWFVKQFSITQVTDKDIERFMRVRGPYTPDLVKYLKRNKSSYDVFIFFSFLYYPTVVGMPLVKEKSIFIPTAHDEEPLYTTPYRSLFEQPRFIMYNTVSEKKLVENYFGNYTVCSAVAGVGIETDNLAAEPLPDGLIPKSYFLYMGRIDEAKGCATMLDDFLAFYDRYPEWRSMKLVLVGNNYLPKEYKHPSVLYMGFVSEGTKYALLNYARALIMPSLHESLSLVTLEAMAVGCAVIVNRACEVLYDHVRKSGAGQAYTGQEEFFTVLENTILKDERTMNLEGERAKAYVSLNYSWANILEKFDYAIDYVISSNT